MHVHRQTDILDNSLVFVPPVEQISVIQIKYLKLTDASEHNEVKNEISLNFTTLELFMDRIGKLKQDSSLITEQIWRL